jgi:L,D-transpeptidase YcbB
MNRRTQGVIACLLAGVLVLAARPGAAAQTEGVEGGVAEALRELLEQLQTTGRLEVGNEALVSRNALPAIYEEGGYRAYWTPERLTILLELVRQSEEDGLRPEDYHLAALSRVAPGLANSASDAVTRAQVDLLATDAFYLLLYHLYVGKVDPKSLDPKWNFDLRPVREPGGIGFVVDALTQGTLRETVARVRPDHWWYQRARAALARYRGLAAQGGWKAIPPGKPLKIGMADPRVPALRKRLAATGELSGGPLDSTEYDEPLAKAVAAFQESQRLDADGAVGATTLAELNVPVEARIMQVRVNLERGRWVLQEITGGDLVIVDVAGFEVDYSRDRSLIWKSKIQVGKPYRQTPIFKSKIDLVVFNPTWTVPPGIFANDILPAVKRDPSYLQKKGLNVIDGSGRKVDPSTIDWSKTTAGNFRYMLRQEPGPDNALGRSKFMFPNPYSVYLHDTPHRALFEKEERAFSSGCMRVEKPLELARLLLNDDQKWNVRAIDEVLDTVETRTIRLAQPVPVLIMYWTIDLSVEGRVGFKRDPYKRDPRLAKALDAPFRVGNRWAP